MPAFWGVVRSNPKREAFAAERVEALGYPVFLPLVPLSTKRGGVNEGRPLFAGYFFAQITSSWRPIATCFGVLCILKTGDCPSKMPDREVDALKAMVVGGFVRLPGAPGPPGQRKLAIGARVKIASGSAFSGWEGLYQGQAAKDRERVLLGNLLGGPRIVTIASNLVVPA